jgi:betaine-homocysteine S-methyltransferase
MGSLSCVRRKGAAAMVPRAFSSKRDLIAEMRSGKPIIGDGGFVFELEKRGFVKAGPWTPEATCEFPHAVRQLHVEFARAGADVMQTFTFYASEDKLKNRGNEAAAKFGARNINKAACDLAREVATQFNGFAAGGICQTPIYLTTRDEKQVKAMLGAQCDVFMDENVDFMIAEYFEHAEEARWAVEVCKEKMPDKPVAVNMCIGKEGDMHGMSTYECAKVMADTGAEIIGLNCHFGPNELTEAMYEIKRGVESMGLSVTKDIFLMVQPVIYHVPDASKQGFIDLPEFPFALEPRIATRWEIQKWARENYEMGVRYLGGCCGYQPYHIRAIAEELEKERGVAAPGSDKHEKWGKGLEMHTKPWVRARGNKEHWSNIKPSCGRPHSSAFSTPDNWGVTAGDAELKQHAERK